MPTVPAWWPAVHRAARHRREFTALLLDRATPGWDGTVLRLAFADPADVRDWHDSESGLALDAALAQHGVQADVNITHQ